MLMRSSSWLRDLLAIAAISILAMAAGAAGQAAAARSGEPTDAKARKTFAEAMDWERHGQRELAVDAFRKANKQDGGRCVKCLNRAYELAMDLGDYKTAAAVTADMLPLAQSDADRATLHLRLGVALQRQGIVGKKDKYFNQSCDEFKTALALDPALAGAHYCYGVSLAYLHQDDAARAEFKSFVDRDRENEDLHQRAQRYVERVELARARMAPPFEVTTLDGRHISMDSLAGKVVLIDFWATWCGPCREALPHIEKIVQKFQGQPFVAISVSMDDDDTRWRDFVAKNGMTWPQYRDGRFTGPMATRFAVNAIPATFSIDADGVLEDQHVGDADIEGKLKKMIARAVELEQHNAAEAAGQAQGSGK